MAEPDRTVQPEKGTVSSQGGEAKIASNISVSNALPANDSGPKTGQAAVTGQLHKPAIDVSSTHPPQNPAPSSSRPLNPAHESKSNPPVHNNNNNNNPGNDQVTVDNPPAKPLVSTAATASMKSKDGVAHVQAPVRTDATAGSATMTLKTDAIPLNATAVLTASVPATARPPPTLQSANTGQAKPISASASATINQQALDDPQEEVLAAIRAQRTKLTDPYHPFICPSDTSVDDARRRLEIALEQTRQLRQAFTERVYGKYRVCLKPPPSLEEILEPIQEDPTAHYKKLMQEVDEYRAEKDIEKKEASQLNVELSRTKTAAAELNIDHAEQLMFTSAGLNLVILPEETKVTPSDLKDYKDGRGPTLPTGQRNRAISNAAATAGEVILDRTRRAAAMRADRLGKSGTQKTPQAGSKPSVSTIHSRLNAALKQAEVEPPKPVPVPAPAAPAARPPPIVIPQPTKAAVAKSKSKSAPSPRVNATTPRSTSVTKGARGRLTQSGIVSATSLLSLHPHSDQLDATKRRTASTAALISAGVGNLVPQSRSSTQWRLRHPHPDSLGGRRRAGGQMKEEAQQFSQELLKQTLPPLPLSKDLPDRKPIAVLEAKEASTQRAKDSVGTVLEPFQEANTEPSPISKISMLHHIWKVSGKGPIGMRKQPVDQHYLSQLPDPDSKLDPAVTYLVMRAVGLVGNDPAKCSSRLSKRFDKAPSLKDGRAKELRQRIEKGKSRIASDLLHGPLKKRPADALPESPSKRSKQTSASASAVDASSSYPEIPVTSIRGGGDSNPNNNPNNRNVGPHDNPTQMPRTFFDPSQQPSIALPGYLIPQDNYRANPSLHTLHLAHQLQTNTPIADMSANPQPFIAAHPQQGHFAVNAPGQPVPYQQLGGTGHPYNGGTAISVLMANQNNQYIAHNRHNVRPQADAQFTHYPSQAPAARTASQSAASGQRPAVARPVAKTSTKEPPVGTSKKQPSAGSQKPKQPEKSVNAKKETSLKSKTSTSGHEADSNKQRAAEASDKLSAKRSEDSIAKVLPLKFIEPSLPKVLDSHTLEQIRKVGFHLVANKLSFDKKKAAIEYLVARAAAVPIPKEPIVHALRNFLDTPGMKNLGIHSNAAIPRDVIVSVILVWLWKNHEAVFQGAFDRSGRIDADPECKWLFQAAADVASREIAREIEKEKLADSGPFVNLAKGRKIQSEKPGEVVPTAQEMTDMNFNVEVRSAVVVCRALSGELYLSKECNELLPEWRDALKYLDELRLFALQSKAEERTLLANLVARKTTMTDSFSHAYLSSLVRAGEALGHDRIFEIVQKEEIEVASMVPYDVFTDDNNEWEDPCKPKDAVSIGLTSDVLMKRAHARAMIQKSLRKLQDKHGIKGGTTSAGPYAEAGANQVHGPGKSPPASSPRPGPKRRHSISDPPVPPGTGSARALNWNVFTPRHITEALDWDYGEENTPYGRHSKTRPRALSITVGARDSKKFKKVKAELTNETPEIEVAPPRVEFPIQSTVEIPWADVADIFESVEIPQSASRSTSSSQHHHESLLPADGKIFAPFCRKISSLESDPDESDTEEDTSDSAIAAKHEKVLAEMKLKISAYMEARRRQQERRRSRKK